MNNLDNGLEELESKIDDEGNLNEEPVKEDEKPDPLAQITESLASINENFNSLTGRIDSMEERLIAPKTEVPKSEEEKAKMEEYSDDQPEHWSDMRREQAETARRIAREEAESLLTEREKSSQAKIDEQNKIQESINADYDAQLAKLEQEGILPAMVDSENKEDPGRLARKEVVAVAIQMKTTDLLAAGELVKEMHEVGKTFDTGAKKWLRTKTSEANQNVPVGSSSATGANTPAGLDWKTIQNARSLDEIAAKFDLD